MNKYALALVYIPLVVVSFVVSAGTGVTTTGSTTVLAISQLVAEALGPQGVDLTVTGGGSGVGISAFIDGMTDICASSRYMTQDEFAQAVVVGHLPYIWEIAIDALSIIVNPANPVTQITYDQLNQIFLCQVTNWKELGGPDLPIVAISRDSSSGTYGTFRDVALNKQDVCSSALFQSSNAAVATSVATTPGAIGYVGFGYLNPSVKALPLSKTADGPFVTPTVASAIDFSYPLSRPLFYITNGFPQGAIARVIAYILSDAGQQLVLDAGYAPVRPLAAPSSSNLH